MRKKNVNRTRKGKKSIQDKAMKAAIGSFILFAAPASSLALSTLAADLTAYYQEHREGIHNELSIGLYDGPFNINRQFTPLDGVTDELVLTEDAIGNFIHQHVPTSATTFNPTAGAITPKARVLKMRAYEGDLQFQDGLIERTHLMYQSKMKQLANSNSPDKTQTFIEYLFWDHIMKAAKEQLRKALFQATFDDTGSYSWNKILDGWEALIAAAVTATEITPVSLASLTASNIVTETERVFDTLDVAVKGAEDLVVALHADAYKLWIRANRVTLGRKDVIDSANELTLDGYPNARVIQEPHFTTTKIAVYRTSNPVVCFNNAGGTWEFQRFDRLTKMMLNGKVGLQFTSINSGGKNNVAIGQ